MVNPIDRTVKEWRPRPGSVLVTTLPEARGYILHLSELLQKAYHKDKETVHGYLSNIFGAAWTAQKKEYAKPGSSMSLDESNRYRDHFLLLFAALNETHAVHLIKDLSTDSEPTVKSFQEAVEEADHLFESLFGVSEEPVVGVESLGELAVVYRDLEFTNLVQSVSGESLDSVGLEQFLEPEDSWLELTPYSKTVCLFHQGLSEPEEARFIGRKLLTSKVWRGKEPNAYKLLSGLKEQSIRSNRNSRIIPVPKTLKWS